MRAAQVSSAGTLELVDREIPAPGRGQVRIKVEACGICHSDSLTVENQWAGLVLPRVPGHEAAGVIEALGEDVVDWRVGERVGVGWFGGNCGNCEGCRRGEVITCTRLQVPGISYDGGYATHMVAPTVALARIPADLAPQDAGPLMCAGITTFNALRNSGARASDLVAVHGIGGLGHLGVQFAAHMGFRVAAIARGQDKAPFARSLGAHHYIDSQSENVAEALQKLGGARVVLATAVDAPAIASTLGGLGILGTLVLLGIPGEPLAVEVLPLILGKRRIQGWPCGSSIDSEDTLSFAAVQGVRPQIEEFPLEQANEAYQRMRSGKARFRVVLKMP